MQSNPLITVITTTYNLINAKREQTFKQCVKSVQNQTYKNIEHIVIDGASTDGTLDLIKEYADKGIVKYFSEPDDGIYDAFNKGIQKANGKYIVFLNSDDFYHNKNGLSDSIKLLKKTNSDFSCAPWIQFEEEKNKRKLKQPKPELIFFKMPFCHQTMIAKKDLLIESGMFDTSYKLSADYDLTLKLVLKGAKLVKVPTCFVTFRQGGESSLNDVKLNNEYSVGMQKNYSELFDISFEECNQIQIDRVITRSFYKKLLPCLITDYKKLLLGTFIKSQLRKIRRELIVIRTKSGQRQLKLLGVTIIQE